MNTAMKPSREWEGLRHVSIFTTPAFVVVYCFVDRVEYVEVENPDGTVQLYPVKGLFYMKLVHLTVVLCVAGVGLSHGKCNSGLHQPCHWYPGDQ